jgi:hypothetical protein
MNIHKLTFLIILTSFCSAIQIIPRPPDVEFTSFFSFVAGLTEGALVGALLGSITMVINGFLSPWGFGGLNIPFQMAGMIIAAVLGSVYKRFTPNISFSARFSVEAAILGALIALVYEVITNVGYGLQLVLFGEGQSLALLTALATGFFYSLLHVTSNTLVFGSLFLPLTNALNRLGVGEPHWSKKERLYSQYSQ